MPLQFSIDCFEVGEHDTAIWLEQVPAETVQVINSNADDAGGSPILFYKNTSGSSDFSHLRKASEDALANLGPPKYGYKPEEPAEGGEGALSSPPKSVPEAIKPVAAHAEPAGGWVPQQEQAPKPESVPTFPGVSPKEASPEQQQLETPKPESAPQPRVLHADAAVYIPQQQQESPLQPESSPEPLVPHQRRMSECGDSDSDAETATETQVDSDSESEDEAPRAAQPEMLLRSGPPDLLTMPSYAKPAPLAPKARAPQPPLQSFPENAGPPRQAPKPETTKPVGKWARNQTQNPQGGGEWTRVTRAPFVPRPRETTSKIGSWIPQHWGGTSDARSSHSSRSYAPDWMTQPAHQQLHFPALGQQPAPRRSAGLPRRIDPAPDGNWLVSKQKQFSHLQASQNADQGGYRQAGPSYAAELRAAEGAGRQPGVAPPPQARTAAETYGSPQQRLPVRQPAQRPVPIQRPIPIQVPVQPQLSPVTEPAEVVWEPLTQAETTWETGSSQTDSSYSLSQQDNIWAPGAQPDGQWAKPVQPAVGSVPVPPSPAPSAPAAAVADAGNLCEIKIGSRAGMYEGSLRTRLEGVAKEITAQPGASVKVRVAIGKTFIQGVEAGILNGSGGAVSHFDLLAWKLKGNNAAEPGVSFLFTEALLSSYRPALNQYLLGQGGYVVAEKKEVIVAYITDRRTSASLVVTCQLCLGEPIKILKTSYARKPLGHVRLMRPGSSPEVRLDVGCIEGKLICSEELYHFIQTGWENQDSGGRLDFSSATDTQFVVSAVHYKTKTIFEKGLYRFKVNWIKMDGGSRTPTESICWEAVLGSRGMKAALTRGHGSAAFDVDAVMSEGRNTVKEASLAVHALSQVTF